VQVVNSTVGVDRRQRFDVVMAGDDVPRKKPDPIIYLMASQMLGIAPEKCVVIIYIYRHMHTYIHT
jgi:HAD superfamily hydrolase (TIGR01509 family)